jgi:outer membrane autotransporter protein
MTDLHPYSHALRQHLLGGASIGAMVLCASLVMSGAAQAQNTEVSGDLPLTANVSAQLNGSFSHDGTATTHTITINLNDFDTTVTGVTNNNSNANGLVFDIVDNSGVSGANILTLSGDVAASNDGFITFNVGEGTTDHVSLTVAGNITEADSGATAIVLGNSGGDQAVNLRFASGTATQTIDAAITVVDDGDNVSLTIGNDALGTTTTFNDTITLRAGDAITIGASDVTTANFMADVVAPGGIMLSGNAATTATFADDVTASISLNTSGADQTLNLGTSGQTTTATGVLDVTDSTRTATLNIVDGANVTLAGGINSAAAWDAINVGGGTTATSFTVQGDIADESNITLNDLATLVIDSTGGARTVASTVNADAAGSTVTLQTVGDPSGDGNGVTFNVDVGGVNAIDTMTFADDVFFLGALTGGSLSAATDVDAILFANSTLTGDITGAGNLIIGNAASDLLTLGGGTGTSSTVSIASIGGPGGIQIASGSSVIMNSRVLGSGANSGFTMNSADTTLTVNSTAATAITATGTLTLDQGTIVLGSNIGAGDTAFNVASLTHSATANTVVQLSAGFTNGSIVFIDADGDESGDLVNFTLTDNALATYALTAVNDEATTDNIVITATARTADETATQLGVSSEVADTVLQAVTSATTAGDTTGLNALSAELNAGGTRATQAANQVGVQGDAVGASSGVAFQVSGQQQDLASNRLGALRGASDSSFASAFSSSGESGFSGGDLDGFTAYPPETRGSIWFEGFGGIASADGDSNAAGYDAAFGGATIGIDGTISDQVTVGLMGAYTASSVDGDGAGNAQMDANTYQIALYGSYSTDGFYLDGFAGYAYAENELTRTAVGQTITADYGSSQFTAGLAGGVPLAVGSDVYLTPNASLTYNHYAADSYTETGSLGFSSRVTPDSVSQLTGTIGARIHAVYESVMSDGTSMVPELRVALAYDIIDDDATSAATFTGGGTSYAVTGTNTDDLGALVGLGLSFDNPDWSAGIAYDADIRSDFMSHTASAEYRFRF